MSTVQQLENTVRQLSANDLAAFRAWFAEFDAEQWDRQFEADVRPVAWIGWWRRRWRICAWDAVQIDEPLGLINDPGILRRGPEPGAKGSAPHPFGFHQPAAATNGRAGILSRSLAAGPWQ